MRWSLCILVVSALLLTRAWAAGDEEEDDAKVEAKAARSALRKKVWDRVHTRIAQKWYCARFLKQNPDKGLNETNCRVAAFGGGSFLKLKEALSAVPGVVNASLGYTGGWKRPASYGEVCADKTGHSEVVLTYWNRHIVNFTQLLRAFAAAHDPANKAKQGKLVGLQYRSVVFATTAEQLQAFRDFKEEWNLKAQEKKTADLDEPVIIRTEINRLRPANFYPETHSPEELQASCAEATQKVAEKVGTLSDDEKTKIEQRLTTDLAKLKEEPRESVEIEREKAKRTRAARVFGRRIGRRPRPDDEAAAAKPEAKPKAEGEGNEAEQPAEDAAPKRRIKRPATEPPKPDDN